MLLRAPDGTLIYAGWDEPAYNIRNQVSLTKRIGVGRYQRKSMRNVKKITESYLRI